MTMLAGRMLQLADPANRDLDGFYPMSEGAGVFTADATPRQRHGKLVNAVFDGGTAAGEGMIYTSANGGVELPVGTFDYTDEDFTISFTVIQKTNATSTWAGNFYSSSRGWGIVHAFGGQVTFRTNTAGSTLVTATSAGVITPGRTHAMRIVKRGETARIYVDMADKTVTFGSHAGTVKSDAKFYIGNSPESISSGSGLVGWIGGVAVNTRAYTPEEARGFNIAQDSRYMPRRVFSPQSFLAARLYHQRQHQGMAA